MRCTSSHCPSTTGLVYICISTIIWPSIEGDFHISLRVALGLYMRRENGQNVSKKDVEKCDYFHFLSSLGIPQM